MGTHVDQTDLENAISARTVAALYDDANDGTINTGALALNIDRAESLVDAQLIGFYPFPLLAPTDRLAKHASLNFLICFSFERHPEYVKTFGDGPRATDYYARGKELLGEIQAGVKKLPDQPSPATTPKNVGGVIRDVGPRLMVPSVDGTDNGNGF